MNILMVLGVIVGLVMLVLFLKSHGGQTPQVGDAGEQAKEKATGLVDSLMANPDFMTKWLPSLAVAALLMLAWAKFPKLRYVFLGVFILWLAIQFGVQV